MYILLDNSNLTRLKILRSHINVHNLNILNSSGHKTLVVLSCSSVFLRDLPNPFAETEVSHLVYLGCMSI